MTIYDAPEIKEKQEKAQAAQPKQKQEMNHVQSAIPTLHLNLLKKTWSDKLIPPKVKTFMWRLIRNALPTANNLHFRIPDILDSCHRCNSAKTSVHLFFHCSFARLSWMISDFKLNFQIIDSFGLFLHDPTSHKALFVKASSDTYTSALQAEHASIYVALCICQKLKITDVVLVKQLRQRNFAAHPQHWSLLPLLQRSE
uniref:Reverse transcriptase zinc-binding domain-containing protein n=1 Tax=Oryza meridionalis TaxID=40149 RepID=A0A0E0EMY4_9ORYZ